jgi:glycerol-3-phosphate dehydrogenase (NAD(P)+)
LEQLADVDLTDKTFISLTKGVERATGRFPTEVIAEILQVRSAQVLALSGPNLARELGQRLPAGAMLAGADLAVARDSASAIRTDYFRLWPTDDVRGVEVAGVYKNVLAIAVGVARAAGLGNDFSALLVTTGLAEMADFGAAFGARRETFYGAAGLGDLLTTAYSDDSRNQTFGRLIGELGSVTAATEAAHHTVEGRYSVDAVVELAAGKTIDVPIAQLVANMLDETIDVAEFLVRLRKELLQ